MSGIAGLLNLDGAPVDLALLERMTQHLAVRGPDARATWAGGPIGLGHTLLRSTFESAQEAQPCTLDGAVWIVADARVDGRAELVDKLRPRGRDADSDRPDVELILHAYAAWDTRCVEHLIGDFAFAIWDSRQRRLFCARDQFGVTPFFYTQVNRTLAFSNTLDCLRLQPGLSDELNEQTVGDLLLFRTNHNPGTTILAGVQRLPPAHTLICAAGVPRLARYWSVPQPVAVRYRPAGETVAQFQSLFDQAVGDRLRTDRVAVPMSGGLDSSSVAVTAQRLLQSERVGRNGPLSADWGVRAYTITADHLIQDEERYYAGLVAAHANLPVEYRATAPAEAVQLGATGPVGPEPGPLAPAGAQDNLAVDMARYSRVVLSGLGGDPLLYPSRTFLADLVRRGDWVHLARVMGEQLLRQGRLPPLYIRSGLKRRLGRGPTAQLPGWINPAFAARCDLAARWRQISAAIEAQDPRQGMAESPLWANLLSQGDPGYTAVLIRVRHPFFDVRLLGFMLSVPPVPWCVKKTLLREAMRGRLPQPVLRRPKTPLSADPVYARAQQHPLAWMSELAASPELEPYVNRAGLSEIIRLADQASQQDFAGVYAPLALAYWLRGQTARTGKTLAVV